MKEHQIVWEDLFKELPYILALIHLLSDILDTHRVSMESAFAQLSSRERQQLIPTPLLISFSDFDTILSVFQTWRLPFYYATVANSVHQLVASTLLK